MGPEQNVILCEVSVASSVSGQNPVRVRLVGPSPAARRGAGEREREELARAGDTPMDTHPASEYP